MSMVMVDRPTKVVVCGVVCGGGGTNYGSLIGLPATLFFYVRRCIVADTNSFTPRPQNHAHPPPPWTSTKSDPMAIHTMAATAILRRQ